ncbi:hypothetical protein DL546_009869 [Coniochaeta pulveracea]|uniref:Uncharacterized protein n=1 Tax=Coniochaeta pulveracea TaxID=177199 RepID=A0A420YP93_9PEZI|nr:hypothetical protein DL546_009869 [Coniochaeta pulveracea]
MASLRKATIPAIVTSNTIHLSARSSSPRVLLLFPFTTPSSSPVSNPSADSSHKSPASSLTVTATLLNSTPAPSTITPNNAPGNIPITRVTASPKTNPSNNFTNPSRMILAPLRAPKRH